MAENPATAICAQTYADISYDVMGDEPAVIWIDNGNDDRGRKICDDEGRKKFIETFAWRIRSLSPDRAEDCKHQRYSMNRRVYVSDDDLTELLQWCRVHLPEPVVQIIHAALAPRRHCELVVGSGTERHSIVFIRLCNKHDLEGVVLNIDVLQFNITPAILSFMGQKQHIDATQ
jgi:hypothetical protein